MGDTISCSRCHRELRSEAKFCDECGTPVMRQARRPAGGELRTVTVLFADVKGYTTLAETLEPDDVHDVVRRLFLITDDAIDACGGRVEKHMGDAVLALFGVPVATERDPENAVRAALEIQNRLVELNTALVAEKIPRVELRIGINTGRVAVAQVGREGERETSVYGDTVNIAARLESACPPGGVLISSETWRYLEGRFSGRRLPAVKLRGRQELVTPFLVETRPPMETEVATEVLGQRTELVSRRAELAAVNAAFTTCRQEESPRAIVIEGDPGSGKSRLMQAFLDGQREHFALLLRARATPETRTTPYELVAGLLGSAPEIDDSLLKAFQGHAEEGDLAEQRRLLASWLVERTTQGPVVLALDDLQWADTDSLTALTGLVEEASGRPFFLVGTSRKVNRDSPLPVVGAHRVKLEPLGTDDIRDLVTHLLSSVVGVPAEAILSLASRSGGVPYFAVELVKGLADRGVIEPRGSGWRWAAGSGQGLSALEGVPATVEGLIQSRLDAAGPEAAGLARLGAVLGRRFRRGTLEALAASEAVVDQLGLAGEESLAPGIEALVQREILRREGDHELLFVHDLMREVSYSTLPKRVRRGVHLAAARRLEDERTAGQPVPPETIARHHDLGGAAMASARWYRVAGEDSLKLEASEAAYDHFSRALSRLQGRDLRMTAALHLQRATAATNLGRLDEAWSDYESSLETDPDPPPSPTGARAHAGLSYLAYLKGEPEPCREHAEAAAEAAESLDDPEVEARALNILGIYYGSSGHYEKAIELYSAAAKKYEEAGIGARVGTTQSNIGINYHLLGRFDEAIAAFELSLQMAREQKKRHNEGNTLCNLGPTLCALGRLNEAEDAFTKAREIGDALGAQSMIAEAIGGLAEIALARGKGQGALVFALAARELSAAMGMKVYVARAIVDEARAQALLMGAAGSSTLVDERFHEGIALLRRTGERHELADALCAHADFLAAGPGREERVKAMRAEARELYESLDLGWKVARCAASLPTAPRTPDE
ncbi:MAG: adenylate/guanylate cyclase domain-containing protein [Deltaproteobacteria bacterium]|nr:adenylate/guanylate cyclase domain-containing protein [Deltaproteobacteria bacterium]